MIPRIRLQRIEGYPVTLHFSPGYRTRAQALGELVIHAHRFLAGWLGVDEPATLSVLRHTNWRRLRRAPYGYPHSSPEQATIFAPATYPPRLVDRALAIYEGAPHELRDAFASDPAEARRRIVQFYDLVAIHELGHLFIHYLRLSLGSQWLIELVANLFATAYFLECAPERAELWMAWAAIQSTQPVTFTSLEEYEEHYERLDFANASYYQGRFNGIARDLWRRHGRSIADALAAEFAITHASVHTRLLRVAPGFSWEVETGPSAGEPPITSSTR